MASLSFVRYLINCDGCRAIFGTQTGFQSLTEARAAAYGAGWRFPNLLTAKGVPAASTSDVCPVCAGEWKSQQAGKKLNHQRMLTLAEIAVLPVAGVGAQ